MTILIKILQFVLSFSLLVIVHEIGHFVTARIFGVRVDQFQLFFGRPIWSITRKGTRYGIGWIPFGGYVKLAGMIDESMDTDFVSQEPQPHEFRSKPAWQRLLIMTGGVIMNVILAFFIYVGMNFVWGEKYLSTDDMKYGYVFNEPAKEMGFRDGDIIVSFNGKEYKDFNRLNMKLIIRQKNTVVVERDGELVEIRTPETSVMKSLENPDFIMPRYPFIVGQIVEGSGAAEAGMQTGDRLISLNGEPMFFFDEYVPRINELSDEDVSIGIERDSSGLLLNKQLEVHVSESGKIGAGLDMLATTPLHHETFTFWQAVPAGFNRVGREIGDYWDQLKLIAKPKTEAYKSLGGPIGIGNIFPSKWNWEHFWNITALLSIVLAVMNILPIPGLDGGHVMFLLYEVVTRRKPSDKFMMYAQVIGMTLLFALILYATWNDIYRLFIK